MVSRWRMVVQYDGTSYYGFQRQKGKPTIQGELEKALKVWLRTEIKVIAASRTDRGTHALGQVVAFDIQDAAMPDNSLYHLNAILPPDIRVVKLEPAENSFHPRHHALARHYSYLIYNAPFASPFLSCFSYHCQTPLVVEEMEIACHLFLGQHDFEFFTTAEEKRSKIRSIDRIEVQSRGNLIEIKFSGRSFLHNMIRMIAASLCKVGLKEITKGEITAYLNKTSKPDFPPLPAQGLFLVKIDYPDGFTDDVSPVRDIPFPGGLL